MDEAMRSASEAKAVRQNASGLMLTFVTVDIEILDASVAQMMRAGRHTFRFLVGAVELTAVPKEQCNVLAIARSLLAD